MVQDLRGMLFDLHREYDARMQDRYRGRLVEPVVFTGHRLEFIHRRELPDGSDYVTIRSDEVVLSERFHAKTPFSPELSGVLVPVGASEYVIDRDDDGDVVGWRLNPRADRFAVAGYLHSGHPSPEGARVPLDSRVALEDAISIEPGYGRYRLAAHTIAVLKGLSRVTERTRIRAAIVSSVPEIDDAMRSLERTLYTERALS